MITFTHGRPRGHRFLSSRLTRMAQKNWLLQSEELTRCRLCSGQTEWDEGRESSVDSLQVDEKHA